MAAYWFQRGYHILAATSDESVLRAGLADAVGGCGRLSPLSRAAPIDLRPEDIFLPLDPGTYERRNCGLASPPPVEPTGFEPATSCLQTPHTTPPSSHASTGCLATQRARKAIG